jgi:phospholipase/carboxylesterase
MAQPALNDYQLEPKSGNPPSSVVVLLHGYGDSGQGLISLAPMWRDALPDTLFLAPNAPYPCEVAPSGFQWFSLQEYNPQTLLSGTQNAHPILDNYLDKVVEETGISSDKVALVGFSQGTMMSLYTGPRRKDKLAGILGYSGALVGGGGLKSTQKPPIRLIHGDNDSVVPVAAYHHAKDILEKNDFPVSGYTTPNLEHSIDEQGIASGQEFLLNILN